MKLIKLLIHIKLFKSLVMYCINRLYRFLLSGVYALNTVFLMPIITKINRV